MCVGRTSLRTFNTWIIILKTSHSVCSYLWVFSASGAAGGFVFRLWGFFLLLSSCVLYFFKFLNSSIVTTICVSDWTPDTSIEGAGTKVKSVNAGSGPTLPQSHWCRSGVWGFLLLEPLQISTVPPYSWAGGSRGFFRVQDAPSGRKLGVSPGPHPL